MIPSIARTLLLLGLLGSAEPISRQTQEPPLRARVTIDGESTEVTLGRPARTADGRPLLVELLPTRFFEIEGALSFAYPKEWTFLASVGFALPVDAWWTLGGQGTNVYLRRHGGDVNEVLLEYVSNLEAMGGSARRAVTRSLGGRELEGWAVEIEVGNVGPGKPQFWVQEVFAWSQEEGVSWLASLQRVITPKPLDRLLYTLPEFKVDLDADGKLTIVEVGSKSDLAAQPFDWGSLLRDFHWN